MLFIHRSQYVVVPLLTEELTTDLAIISFTPKLFLKLPSPQAANSSRPISGSDTPSIFWLSLIMEIH